MRIRDILDKQNGTDRLDALNVVANALSMRKEEVFSNFDQEINEINYLRIKGLLAERKRGRPFAYIARCKEFFSEKFYVDERVLIPRPETEVLVEEALELIAMRPEIENILDMGTGSGAIGLILAKKTQKRIVCTDISLGALLVARQNRENLKLSGQTPLICSDLFDAFGNVEFDMILANLPYIASEEWDSLMTDVKDYEPRTALDGGKEGIAIYKRFVEGLPQHLTKNGYVLCEVGSSEQARKMQEMLLAIGLTVVVKKDLSGLERALVGSWTSLS